MDLAREPGDVLGELLVLLRERGVRLEQLREALGLGFDRRRARCSGPFELRVSLVDALRLELVAVGLARLREQDNGAAYAACVENARFRRMNGYGSQWEIRA
jgi:endonuclease YncB( thermonuclease family)